jgi:hypothetical protein
MRYPARRSIAIGLVILLGSVTAARAGVPPHATLKGQSVRPPAVSLPAPTAPFNCPDADTVTVWALCDTVLVGDTTGAANLVERYGCAPWNEPGGEVFYHLDLRADVRLSASLQNYEADLDIFLLDACDGDACLAGENAVLGLTLAPGHYWLVVDGWEGEQGDVQSGPFEVRLICRYPGVPPEICTGTATIPVAISAGDPYDDSGSLYQQPDLMLLDESCSPYYEDAGEVWYALTLNHRTEITVTVSMSFLDAALWLFDGCGMSAVCLDFADAGVLGEPETLTYINLSGAPQTVYLGVDAFRPPDPNSPDPVLLGSYTLSIGSVLPTQRQSLGGLKGRYR